MTTSLTEATVAELSRLIAARETSPVEVAKAHIDRIDKVEPSVGAFITRLDDALMTAAREAEREIASGNHRGPLHGIPYGAKDLFWTAGTRTTNGSDVDRDFVPRSNATVIDRMSGAGALLAGKLNMTEYAFGPTGENSHYGTPRNPWNPERLCGGSSSGSGGAVAARMLPFALGTDTGGSIRIPSSLCGLTGIKPTFGLLDRGGVTPLAWSMDTVGPLARTAEDAALVLDALRGSGAGYARGLRGGIRGLRVGVPEAFALAIADPEVAAAFRAALHILEGLGAVVTTAEVPEFAHADAAFGVTIVTEGAAAHREKVLREGKHYDAPVRLRIEAGLFMLAESYLLAQRFRELQRRAMERTFGEVDVLAMPTTVIPAPKPGQMRVVVEGKEMPLRDLILKLTRIINLTGHPALSAPCGFTREGLPIGLQLVGRYHEDASLLSAAHAYQQATDWHVRKPPI
ncbi:MAG: amidase [SAR202 cluster bacterium]|nr:amidase [SAR202 cluster bacterium]